MRQKLALGGEVDLLSREEYVAGVRGIVAGLLSLRQPQERIWWPFQVTADTAGNIGQGVSTISPGNGTLYQVPEGMTATLHLISYTVTGANPGNPVTTASQWTEVLADSFQNQPGVWFTPSGPSGWVMPTVNRWGDHGPVFHESQRVTLCGQVAAGAVIVGRLMFTLQARPKVMATRLVAARASVPPAFQHPSPGQTVPNAGHVMAGARTPGAAG